MNCFIIHVMSLFYTVLHSVSVFVLCLRLIDIPIQRNLHPRGLVMVAGGKLTASKTLISNMKHPEAPPANIQMEDGGMHA